MGFSLNPIHHPAKEHRTMSTENSAIERNVILEALTKFARQRPGLEFGNYGTHAAYNAEMRAITRDLRDALVIMDAVRRSSIGADTLREAFKRGFSGRLSWDGKRLDYCVGQYFPTEYRRAVAAVLASALWEHYRTTNSTGETMRATFRRMFRRGIANRYFN
jgi:hypothetical protein